MEDEIVAANIISLSEAKGIRAFFLRSETEKDYELTAINVPYAAIVELTFRSGNTGHQAEYVIGDPYGIIYPVSAHENFLFLWVHDSEPSKTFIEAALREFRSQKGDNPLKILPFRKEKKSE